jgi:hypothetical protein
MPQPVSHQGLSLALSLSLYLALNCCETLIYTYLQYRIIQQEILRDVANCQATECFAAQEDTIGKRVKQFVVSKLYVRPTVL